jgi:hypothetical protein
VWAGVSVLGECMTTQSPDAAREVVRVVLSGVPPAETEKLQPFLDRLQRYPALDPEGLLRARFGDPAATSRLLESYRVAERSRERTLSAWALGLVGTKPALLALAEDLRSDLEWPGHPRAGPGTTARYIALQGFGLAYPREPLFHADLERVASTDVSGTTDQALRQQLRALHEQYLRRVEAFLHDKLGVQWDGPPRTLGLLAITLIESQPPAPRDP